LLISRWMAVSHHPTLWSPDFPLLAQLGTNSDCLANSQAEFYT